MFRNWKLRRFYLTIRPADSRLFCPIKPFVVWHLLFQFLFTSESVGEGHPGEFKDTFRLDKQSYSWSPFWPNCRLNSQILLIQILTRYQGIWNGRTEAFVASDIRAISCNSSFLTHGWLGSDTQNTFQTIPETRKGAIEINIWRKLIGFCFTNSVKQLDEICWSSN